MLKCVQNYFKVFDEEQNIDNVKCGTKYVNMEYGRFLTSGSATCAVGTSPELNKQTKLFIDPHVNDAWSLYLKLPLLLAPGLRV